MSNSNMTLEFWVSSWDNPDLDPEAKFQYPYKGRSLTSLSPELLSGIMTQALDQRLDEAAVRSDDSRKKATGDFLTICKATHEIIIYKLLQNLMKSSHLEIGNAQLETLNSYYWHAAADVVGRSRRRIAQERELESKNNRSQTDESIALLHKFRFGALRPRSISIHMSNSIELSRSLTHYSNCEHQYVDGFHVGFSTFNRAKMVILHDDGAAEEEQAVCAELVASAFRHQGGQLGIYLKSGKDSGYLRQYLHEIPSSKPDAQPSYTFSATPPPKADSKSAHLLGDHETEGTSDASKLGKSKVGTLMLALRSITCRRSE